MDFHASRLSDWQGRDGYYPAQYLSVKRPVKDPTGLVNPESGRLLPVQAHGRALNAQEKEKYGGVYVEYRRVFLVPVQLLPGDFACKPGDVLTTKDGTEHTVQVEALQNYRTQWRLETLALVLAADLRDTIQIERPTITLDGSGVQVKAFPTGPPPNGGIFLYSGLAARVQLLQEEIQDTRGQRSFVATHAVVVSRQIAVTNEDRVNWIDAGGVQRYLDILKVHDLARIDALPVIDALLNP